MCYGRIPRLKQRHTDRGKQMQGRLGKRRLVTRQLRKRWRQGVVAASSAYRPQKHYRHKMFFERYNMERSFGQQRRTLEVLGVHAGAQYGKRRSSRRLVGV